MAPRESYVRGNNELEYKYRRDLVDMIEIALKPPDSGDPSEMQGWGMRLQMILVSSHHCI